MAIPFAQPVKRLGAYPIDESLVLTKAKMLAAVDNEMPSVYFCIGEEDGKFYLYDKRNDVDPVTGKYRVFEGGQGGNYSGLGGIVVDNDAKTISIDQSVIATVEALNAALAEKADAADVYDIATIDTLLSRLEDEIGNKADKENTFTKEEVLALIPDVSDLASKQELADGLADKADASNVYTKEQEDAKLAEKADKATTYTQEQTDALLDEKADKADLDNKASLTVGKISTAGGGEEVHATVSQGDASVGLNYYKQGQEAPDYINLNVGDDYFTFETRDGIRQQIAQKPSMSLEQADNAVTFGTDTELFSVTEETDDVLIQMAIPGEYETGFRVPKSEHVGALLAEKQDIMQFTIVPEASADNEGKVIQFVGATSQTFTNGFFYRCQEVTPATDPKTFEWVRVDVQPAGGGTQTLDEVLETGNTSNRAMTVGEVLTHNPDNGNETEVSPGGVSIQYLYEGRDKQKNATLLYDSLSFSHLQKRPDGAYDIVEDFGMNAANGTLTMSEDLKAAWREGVGAPFVATYEATTYEEVKAAIDADRSIVVNFPNNNSLICVTYATYTTGQNIVMSGIYKFGNDISATSLTLTPANAWSIANDDLQGKLVSGQNIKTINNQSIVGSGDLTISVSGLEAINGDTGQFKALPQSVLVVNYGCQDPDILGRLAEGIGQSIKTHCLVLEEDETYVYSGRCVPVSWKDPSDSIVGDTTTVKLYGVHNGALVIYTIAIDNTDYSSAVWSKEEVPIANADHLGNLSGLTTTDKTNLVSAVNEVNAKPNGVDVAIDKEKWYGTYTDENNVTYQVYTKTIYIPALPATAGITTYQHGISNIKQILSAYGFTTDGFVLNAPRQTAADNIAIYQVQKSATGGIAIEVGKDRSNKSAYVTLIYAKNN